MWVGGGGWAGGCGGSGGGGELCVCVWLLLLNVIVSKEILLLRPLMQAPLELSRPNACFYHFRAFGIDKTITSGSGCFVVPRFSLQIIYFSAHRSSKKII